MNRTDLAAKERKERTGKAKSLMANHKRIGRVIGDVLRLEQ